MADPFHKVRPGEPLKIHAQAWNKMLDVVGNRHAIGADSTADEKASNIVLVKNASGVDVPRFGVLRMGSPLTNLEKSIPIVINGVKPLAWEPFAIAMEPIESGSVGRCAIGGAFPVNVDVCTAEHRYANPKDDDVERLYSSTVGQLQIISRPYQTGRMLAVGAM